MARTIDAAIHVWNPNGAGPGHSPEELLEALDGAGVWGAICIHSRRDSSYDHAATLHAITEYPDRLAGVCVVPPDDPQAPERLTELVGQGFKGARILPYSEQEALWLTGESGDPLWQTAAKLGVPIDIIFRPDQLEQVHVRAVRSPEATVILDHIGLLTVEDTPNRLDRLRDFAKLPNVVCKMSALRHVSRDDFPHRDIHPILRAILDAFGPDRLMYGSDWPNMLEDGVPYDYAIHTIDEALGLTGGDREALFGGTATRIWNLG